MKDVVIKVVIVEPNKPARIELIPNALETFQKIVGGYIECVREEGFDIIINEEGKLEDLEENFELYGGIDYIAGTAIFSGVDYDSGEFKSLTDEQVKFISKIFEGRNQLDNAY